MSYSVNNIVPVTTRFIPGALSFANFGFATLFVTEADAPAGFNPDTFRDYTNTADMQTDGFLSTSESYKAADKWLGSTPRTYQLRVYVKATADASYVDTFAKARNKFWWFITLATIDLYDDIADSVLAAGWNNTNEAMFCYTTNEVAAITPGDMTSYPYQITTLGYRYAFSTYHPTDRYAAFPILSWFATVNYQVDGSTITGEYKTITNVAEWDGDETAYNALKEVKCGFITGIDLQGQTLNNRYINSITHSANQEFIDDVFNAAAFINAIKVSITNATANAPTKIAQTIAGQQVEITTANSVCEQYIANGYLGARNYVNPDTGLTELTRGYEMLTKAEDILDLTPSERTERLSAPLRIRIFRAGAIHTVPVDLTIF